MTPVRQNVIDEKLAKMIATDFQPFSIVEDRGFIEFTHALNPMYVLPSRKTLSNSTVQRLYEREHSAVKDRVRNATAVCLTTDCWTSRNTTSFMSVTCHYIENYKTVSSLLECFEFSERHTAENLADELRVAKEWEVDKKVVCCSSDNAANITKAIRLLKWSHLPCVAHTINLIVRDSLKVMKSTTDKLTAIVEFFHKSAVAAERLKSTQKQMGVPVLRPKQDCVTRWNSTFHMLKRAMESKDAIVSTLAIMNSNIELLTQEEWLEIKEACAVLEPFDQVTVKISADSYVTASKMIILCKGLQRVTAKLQRDGTVTLEKVIELVNALCASMERRFHRMEFNPILAETTILDPRLKKLAFHDSRAVEEAIQRVTAAARSSLSSQQSQTREEGAQAIEEPCTAVWSFFDQRATGDIERRNPTADAMLEIRSYLEEPLIPRSTDPLSWWETKASVYPRLTKVMTGRLCIVATSVPSERIFSKAGQIITERRKQD
ncbi:E3 SUMO-protein ligase ZBED1-like [Alosa pseudoharengus]|uniref:E3 SUMO-protein ligase ZBED1-like n=1 Tax=Alosa pseudoharengus TaxID=34774 RepID=UPI003F8A8856